MQKKMPFKKVHWVLTLIMKEMIYYIKYINKYGEKYEKSDYNENKEKNYFLRRAL